MAVDQNWVEALEIKSEDLQEWSAQAPEGTPLLAWCLEKRLIPLDRYLDWASEAYGIAILDSLFFTTEFNPSALNSIRDNWNPWCFPVYSWEHITIVACVEPPEDREENMVYVLADPTSLQKAWGQAESSEAKKPVEESVRASDLLADDEDSSGLPPPLPPMDMPEGLTTSFKDERTDAEVMVEAPLGVGSMKPKVFKLNLISEGGDKENEPPVVPEPTSPSMIIDIDEKSDSSIASFNLHTNVNPNTGSFIKPAPPPAPAVAVKTQSSITSTSTLIRDTQLTATRVTTPNVEKTLPSETNLASSLEAAFTKIRQDYSGAVILRCQDTNAFLLKWDSKVRVDTKAIQEAIALDTPSLFRIVFKTRMPYHGFAVASEAHQKIFEHLGLKEIPPCVSAIPIVFNNTLVGILLAFGDETAQSSKVLERLQGVTDQLLTQVGSQWLRAS